uniref:Secreted protein n=1 Tax=Achlya hypogyna TaxID=1202772 RepID=A0A0A7CNJ5_ACHHY|nr:secreted protein [Achlya hypogyna]
MRAVPSLVLLGLLAATASAQLQACTAKNCVPKDSSRTPDFCRRACNVETGASDCASFCSCNSAQTSPGYMCANVCRKAKTADECGTPVFQVCQGEDLVCDRSPVTTTPAPSDVTSAPTSAPTTSAPTTSAPTTSAPTTSAPTTSAPTTSAPTTSAPTTANPTPAPSPSETPAPTTTPSSTTPAPTTGASTTPTPSSSNATPAPTGSAQPSVTPSPSTTASAAPVPTTAHNASTPAPVVGDATYCVRGPACGGAKGNCPKKGDAPAAHCVAGIPSYAAGACVAPMDAQCELISGSTYGCVFDAKKTPSPESATADCVPVSVQGDATYCVAPGICGGTGMNCPKKGDAAVADCVSNVKSYLGVGRCVAPADAVCQMIARGVRGCVFPQQQ